MIAAVTGGTGFIGRALVERLLRGGSFTEVRVLTRGRQVAAGARAVQGDLTTDRLEALVDGASVVFHCAGELRNERGMRALHVEGTRRLLDAARGRVARWVQLSSVGAYGRAVREGVIEEDSPLAPEGEYEVTKVEADALLARAGLPWVTLRPSIVFGPGMTNRSLRQWAGAIERGWFAAIGGPGAIANYVYVDDVADALLACARAPAAAGVYVLSDDRPLESFVAAMAAALGRPAPARRLPEAPLRLAARAFGWLPGFPLTESRLDALTRRVSYPSRRIRDQLGYRFATSIEAGLQRFAQDARK